MRWRESESESDDVVKRRMWWKEILRNFIKCPCTTLRWFPACDSLFCSRYATTPPFASPFHCVSGLLCVHRTRASAAPKSTASGFTVLLVASPPVVTCDITPSITLSNEHWRQRTSRPCWSQNRYQGMMVNVLTASLCCHGRMVAA